jgi:hypothetical protein
MKHNILIDLDVLLDTRIATLVQLDPDEAMRLLESGFTSRVTDDLSGMNSTISNEAYQEAYKNRDIETLKTSRMTNYIFELAILIKQMTENLAKDNTRVLDPCVVINYYPYKELDDEVLKQIIYAVEQYITTAVTIKSVYLSPEELDLKAMKSSDILTYITYDFQGWFESAFSIKKGRNGIISYPKLTIIAPKVMPKVDSFDHLDADSKKILQNKTPFEFMKIYWAPMFGIEYCPIEMMSLIDTAIID